MSEKFYDAVLQFMKAVLPNDNKLIDNFYETKKFAADLDLPCEKIHCCINECMLYWVRIFIEEIASFVINLDIEVDEENLQKGRLIYHIKRCITFLLYPDYKGCML